MNKNTFWKALETFAIYVDSFLPSHGRPSKSSFYFYLPPPPSLHLSCLRRLLTIRPLRVLKRYEERFYLRNDDIFVLLYEVLRVATHVSNNVVTLAQISALRLTLIAFLRGFGFSVFDVAVVVQRQILFITFQEQLEPFCSVDSRDFERSVVACWKTLRLDMLVEGVSVASVENYSTAQLLAKEWLEESKHHIEDFRLVDDMNAFDSQRNRVLKPINYSFCERWRELPGLLKRQAVHVEDDNRTIDLSFRFQHRGFEEKYTALENFV